MQRFVAFIARWIVFVAVGATVGPQRMEIGTEAEVIAGVVRRAGRRFQPGKSGNPAGARKFIDAVEAMFVELSKDFPPLGHVDRVMLHSASRLLVRAQRAKDSDVAVRLHSEARRSIAELRRHVKAAAPSGPTLSEYLAARADSPDAADSFEDEGADEMAGEQSPAGGLPTSVAGHAVDGADVVPGGDSEHAGDRADDSGGDDA